MCNGSGCQFEISFSGDCGHIEKRHGSAPCNFESDEEYQKALEEWKTNQADPDDW